MHPKSLFAGVCANGRRGFDSPPPTMVQKEFDRLSAVTGVAESWNEVAQGGKAQGAVRPIKHSDS